MRQAATDDDRLGVEQMGQRRKGAGQRAQALGEGPGQPGVLALFPEFFHVAPVAVFLAGAFQNVGGKEAFHVAAPAAAAAAVFQQREMADLAGAAAPAAHEPSADDHGAAHAGAQRAENEVFQPPRRAAAHLAQRRAVAVVGEARFAPGQFAEGAVRQAVPAVQVRAAADGAPVEHHARHAKQQRRVAGFQFREQRRQRRADGFRRALRRRRHGFFAQHASAFDQPGRQRVPAKIRRGDHDRALPTSAQRVENWAISSPPSPRISWRKSRPSCCVVTVRSMP